MEIKPGQTKKIKLKGKSGMFEICVDNTSLFASQRTDSGAPVDMSIPSGYRERIDRMWLIYDYDSAFRYLIDRIAQYGSNGFSIFSPKPEELEFWNEWKLRLNEGIPTVIPGLEEVVKWNMKHLSMGAIAYNNWQWGTMKIGKRDYEVPVKWTLHNQKSIVMTRAGSGFSDYKAGIYIAKEDLTEGSTNWAKAYNVQKPTDITKDGRIYFPKDPTTYFVLRLNSTPADLTRIDKNPKSDEAGFSLYPTPPFLSLLPTLQMRQQLRAMDLNIVDGFINKLVIWKIGDKDFPPEPEIKNPDGSVKKKSTIAIVSALITKENKSNVLQLFVPYWIDLDIRTPDINPLISTDKYMQSWIELMQAFGIFVNPKTGASTEFKLVNTQNFEQMVEYYRRQHIELMLENVVLREIAKRNKLKPPKIIFNPLNTVTNEFLQNMREVSATGRISTSTLLKYHGLEKSYELPLIMNELNDKDRFKEQWKDWSEVEIFNANAPVKFKQEVVGEDGKNAKKEDGKPKDKTKKTIKSTDPAGRPNKRTKED